MLLYEYSLRPCFDVAEMRRKNREPGHFHVECEIYERYVESRGVGWSPGEWSNDLMVSRWTNPFFFLSNLGSIFLAGFYALCRTKFGYGDNILVPAIICKATSIPFVTLYDMYSTTERVGKFNTVYGQRKP